MQLSMDAFLTPIETPNRTMQRTAGRRDVRLQSRSFARWNQSRDAAPTPTGLAEIVGDDFPVLHAMDCALFGLYTAMTNERSQ